MSTYLNKSIILNEIKRYYEFSTDAEFARYLGIKPQTLASWHTRNTFDIDLLYTKCYILDGNWLLTGQGPMIKKKEGSPEVLKEISSATESKQRTSETKIDHNTHYEKDSDFIHEKIKAIDRLYIYFETKKLKIGRVERETGLSSGYLSVQKKRGSDMGSGIIAKLITYCKDLNAEWLLTGKGEIIKREEVHDELIKESSEEMHEVIKSKDRELSLQHELLEIKQRLIENLDKEIKDLKAKLASR